MSDEGKASWFLRIMAAAFFVFPAIWPIENGLYHRIASLVITITFVSTQLEYKDPRYYKWAFGFAVMGLIFNPVFPVFGLPREIWALLDLLFAALIIVAPTKNSGFWIPENKVQTEKNAYSRPTQNSEAISSSIPIIIILFLIGLTYVIGKTLV